MILMMKMKLSYKQILQLKLRGNALINGKYIEHVGSAP